MKNGVVYALALVVFVTGSATAHASVRAPTAARTVVTDGDRLSAAGDHACRVVDDGTVRCWGENGSGQLGDGTRTDRLTPVTVLGNAVAVATGFSHTCALLADGTVRCWGENAYGQLGDGTTGDRLRPVAVGGLSNVVALTVGSAHTCALRADGTARCWGRNGSGQVGDARRPQGSHPSPSSDSTTR